MSQTGLLTKEMLKIMTEQVVVSFIDCVKVFELKVAADTPTATLVGELAGTKALLNPQEFVQPPAECSSMTEIMQVFQDCSSSVRESIKFT